MPRQTLLYLGVLFLSIVQFLPLPNLHPHACLWVSSPTPQQGLDLGLEIWVRVESSLVGGKSD
jgi:hypothetical protein